MGYHSSRLVCRALRGIIFLVRLSRKIQKLFSPEIFASLWENAGRWIHPVNAKRILGSIDKDELARLREKYPHRRDARKINAYENADYWVGVNVKRVQDLWLDRTPPVRILDLGCGPGYFLYVCRLFGHDGLGLDQDEEPLFRGMTEFFNVHRIISRIDPGVPLPDLVEKFDLVTAHRVCFHRINRGSNGVWNEWKPSDWKFFINDIRTRFLKPGGRLLLDFISRPDGSSFFTPELRACFVGEGARIFRSKALFAADPNQRARFKHR
ncbi:MAG: methyltransferase domain-containing protein [Verrucomicrobiota bacterium]